jgi:hypothetical protein
MPSIKCPITPQVTGVIDPESARGCLTYAFDVGFRDQSGDSAGGCG